MINEEKIVERTVDTVTGKEHTYTAEQLAVAQQKLMDSSREDLLQQLEDMNAYLDFEQIREIVGSVSRELVGYQLIDGRWCMPTINSQKVTKMKTEIENYVELDSLEYVQDALNELGHVIGLQIDTLKDSSKYKVSISVEVIPLPCGTEH